MENKSLLTTTCAAWVVLVALGAMSALAQSTRDHGAAIIFTPPKSDTVSSNLHKLNQKESPFKGVESSIRKPLELFDGEAARSKMVVPRQYVPTNQRMNQQSMKSILEKTAEEEFLKGEDRQTDDPYDPFKSPDYLSDPYKKKPKTALDRYYDRLDTANNIRTNAESATDIFGKPRDKIDSRTDPFSRTFGENDPNNPYPNDSQPPSRWGRPMTNSNGYSDNASFNRSRSDASERFQTTGSRDAFERTARQRETRLDNFKRLLDGNASTPADNFNAALPPATTYSPSAPNYNFSTGPAARPGYISPASTFTPSRISVPEKPNPSSSFSKSAGVVGTPSRPAGIEPFSVSAGASLSTPIAPAAQPKRAPSTYSPPTRR